MMKTFDFENQARNLPDVYRKDSESNNAKILDIEKTAVDALEADIQAVLDALDIDIATGYTLDMLGESINQPRNGLTDSQYRLSIKAKIQQNLSGSDFNSVLQSICAAFGCMPDDIRLLEDDSEPAVTVDKISLEALNRAGYTAQQAYYLIKSLLPIGVRLNAFLTEGTFEFSASTSDEDEDAGFGSTEDAEIGGYFGDIIS